MPIAVMEPYEIFQSPPSNVEIVRAGEVYLPTGQLVVADPCAQPRAGLPLDRMVAPGSYPVEVAIAQLPSQRRIAAARVVFSERAPDAWEDAVFETPKVPGSRRRRRRSGPGIPVDYALVGFFDYSTCPLMGEPDEETGEGAIPIDDIYAPGCCTTCTWTSYVPLAGDPRNVIVVSAGWGDGEYLASVALDEDCEVQSVVVDFGVID